MNRLKSSGTLKESSYLDLYAWNIFGTVYVCSITYIYIYPLEPVAFALVQYANSVYSKIKVNL